jgi:hypothetical protein
MGIHAYLGSFLDARKLVAPEALKGAGPFMERADGFGVGAIEHLAAVPANVNEADFEQDAKMLGDGGLGKPEGGDDSADGALVGDEEGEDVAAAGFGDSIEGVGGCGGAWHE